MLKRYDVAMHEALEGTAAGKAPPPVRVYGLESGLDRHRTQRWLPRRGPPRIEDVREQVITGKVAVPCIPSDTDVAAR